MRDLNTCKAEVLRRSEQRIQDCKRKRKRILAWCIPLCMIGSVCSVTVFPSLLSVGSDGVTGTNSAAPESEQELGGVTDSYTRVEIQSGADLLQSYEYATDKATVATLYATVQSFFESTNDADSGDGDKRKPTNTITNTIPSESIPQSNGYTLTFIADNGSRRVYALHNTTLKDKSTGKTVRLSDTQVEDLIKMISR